MRSREILQVTSPVVARKGKPARATVPAYQFKAGYVPEEPHEIVLPSNIDGMPLVRGVRVAVWMQYCVERPEDLNPKDCTILSSAELAQIPQHQGGDQIWG